MRISDWSSDVCSSDLHGLPSSAVGVVLPGRGATHAGAAVLDGAEQPVAIDLRHVEEALVGVGCRRPHGGGRTGILLAVAVAVVQIGPDRTSLVWGKGVSVRGDLGGLRVLTKKTLHRSRKYDEKTTK